MGARDGATQAAIPHMIYDARIPGILVMDTGRQDHKLILGTHNKYVHLLRLDRRPRDALNRKNVEGAAAAAAAAAPSSCSMT